MDHVNRTLYILLYGKSFVSKNGILLHDPEAEEIWDNEGFPLKGKAKSKWLAYYMGMRSVVFDRWIEQQMDEWKDAVILHLGCGMDSRCLRVDAREHFWFDVDFPAVITERKRYFQESDSYRMIAGDVREADLILGSGRSSGRGHGHHSRILAWRIPWTEEPSGLQATESQRVKYD